MRLGEVEVMAKARAKSSGGPLVVGLLCGREFSFPPAFIHAVNELGKKSGVTAEMVKFGGTKMGEPPRVPRHRRSHLARGGVLPGVAEARRAPGHLRHQQPVLVDGGRQVLQLRRREQAGRRDPEDGRPAAEGLSRRTSTSRQSRCATWSTRSTGTGCSTTSGRPAILKPYSGGGWKHVYKVHDTQELLAAYDRTAPYCMTLQEFIDFDQYVRCFTFGKTDIVPVHYDPRERRYIVDHAYLSSELGDRIVKDAQTINQALGYEMNTIEFAVQDGVPYAIDFLNPAPDFERDRITQHYFDVVLDRMSKLVIDRALSGAATNPWPRWEQMVGLGTAAGVIGQPV